MKEIVPPSPPPLVHNQFESVRELFSKNVVPSYGRFDLVFSHGTGSYLFDVAGKRYLDLGAGIAFRGSRRRRCHPNDGIRKSTHGYGWEAARASPLKHGAAQCEPQYQPPRR
jgi:hypothetical protein